MAMNESGSSIIVDDHLALTSDLNDMWDLHRSMRQHPSEIGERFDGLEQEAEMLMEENAQLKNELAFFQRKERQLESVLRKIKADRQQMVAGGDAIDVDIQMIRGSRQAATDGSAHHEITSLLTDFFHENARLKEKVRRQGELLEQANREASESATRNQKVITELMTKLNTLQMREETICDDQCSAEWSKLRQALDFWTRKCFRDRAALDKMTPQSLREGEFRAVPLEAVLKNVHAKRAYIQSAITTTIFQEILQPSFVLSPSEKFANFLNDLSEEVKFSNSQTWERWRIATSKGLEVYKSSQFHRLAKTYNELFVKVDSLSSKFCGPQVKKDTIREEFFKFLEDCVAFKKKLERQEFEYKFQRSEQGSPYSEDMKSLNYETSDGSTVEICVWPSIYKVSFDDKRLLIEPEAVWTRSAGAMDDVDMVKPFSIKK